MIRYLVQLIALVPFYLLALLLAPQHIFMLNQPFEIIK